MGEQVIIKMNSKPIKHLLNADDKLASLIIKIGNLTYVPHDDNSYGFLVHEILEQMLSTKAARKIHERLQKLCNGNITPERIKEPLI